MNLSPVLNTEIEKLAELQPEGWPDIRKEFTFYLSNSFCHPFKLMIHGSLAGLGTLIVFGKSAWLAHIIVSPKHRKKGYGQFIVNKLISLAAQKGIQKISLVATSLGKSVYEKEGFVAQCTYKAFVRKHKEENKYIPVQYIMPYEEKWQSALFALDEHICGEPRKALINQYLKTTILYIQGEEVLGYFIPELREGPIYAIEQEAGLQLLNLKLSTCSKIAIPEANVAAIQVTKSSGFEEHPIEMKRMSYKTPIRFQAHLVYARIGGNFG